MSDKEVNFDHDEIAYAVKNLRDFAERVEDELAAAAEKMVSTARTETSRNTRDGQPAPIHADFIAAVEQSHSLIYQRAKSISTKLRYMAEMLERASAQARAVEETTAAGLSSVSEWAVGAAHGGTVSMVKMAPNSNGFASAYEFDTSEDGAQEKISKAINAGAYITNLDDLAAPVDRDHV